MARPKNGHRRAASLVARGSALVLELRDALAARGARNIARQFHKLDRTSRFDWDDLSP
jgi:hypothetical protein